MKELDFNIQDIPLFKGITTDSKNEIISEIQFNVKKFKKNEAILFRGDLFNDVMIVLSGELRCEMQKYDGDCITIDFLKTNDIIAPAFIFGNDNSIPVDVFANKDVTLLSFNKNHFNKLMILDNAILINFLSEISNKSQLLSKRIWFNFLNKTISDKIKAYITDNHKNNIISFEPNISELAKKFEVTRPSLSREISSFCEVGILTKISTNTYKVDFSLM